MKLKIVESSDLPSFAPLGIAHAVKSGNLLFISGQISLDSEGNTVGKGDARAQTERIYEILKSILAQENAGLDDVVKLTTFYVNPDDFKTIAEVRNGCFNRGHVPASSSFAVKALAHPDMLVEVEAIAVLDGTVT